MHCTADLFLLASKQVYNRHRGLALAGPQAALAYLAGHSSSSDCIIVVTLCSAGNVSAGRAPAALLLSGRAIRERNNP